MKSPDENRERSARRGPAAVLTSARNLALGSRYRREVMASALASAAIYSLGLITSPILARVLGPSGRGEVAAVLSPAYLIAWLLPFGLPMAAAYYVDTIPEGRLLSTATVFGLTCGGAVCGVFWFAAPGYLANHSDTTLLWARIVLVVLPLNVGMQAALEIRRRRSAGAAWNRWRSAPLVFPAVAIVVLALTGTLTIDTAMVAYTVGSLLPLPLLVARLRASRDRRPSLTTLRTVLPYAWRTAATTSASSVMARLDQVVLAAIIDPGRLGLYVVAVAAASLTNPLTTGLSLALFGHLRDDLGGERSGARFRRSLAIALLISGSVAVVTGVFAPVMLRLAFGSEFEGAAGPLRLLLPGAVALNLLGIIGSKLYADGRPGEMSRAAVLGAAITLAGLALVIRSLGITGAAGVTSTAYVVELVYLVRRGALRMDLGARLGPGSPAGPADVAAVPHAPLD